MSYTSRHASDRERNLDKRLGKLIQDPKLGVWIFAAILVAMVFAFCGLSLAEIYETEQRDAIQSMANVAASVSERLALSLRLFEGDLDSLASLAEIDSDGHLANADEVGRRLGQIMSAYPNVETSELTTIDGERVFASHSKSAPAPAIVEDDPRFNFRSAAIQGYALLGLDTTHAAENGDGANIIIRRPILDRAGKRLAVIDTLVAPSAVLAVFSRFDLLPDESLGVTLTLPDGQHRIMLSRLPQTAGDIGRIVPLTPGVRGTNSIAGTEVYFGPGVIDDIPRLFVSRAVPDSPLVVTVGLKWHHIIDALMNRAPIIAAATLVTTLLIAALALILAWQIDRRLRGEHSLADALKEVADRRRAEIEIQQSKLDSLVRMAGGVAHEFSNLLQPIATLSELGQLDPSAGEAADRAKEYFQQIGQSARLAGAIATDFLTFCGHSRRRHQLIDIEPSLREAVSHAQSFVNGVGEIKLSTEPHLVAWFDELGLVQVMNNLVKNAVEAWQRQPRPGEALVISASAQSAEAGRRTMLRIADNGPGMSDTVRARVFEPFFTTKGASGGTGLGLAVVYGIVNSWGGTVTVESQPERGACFVISLPAYPLSDGTQNHAVGSDSQLRAA